MLDFSGLLMLVIGDVMIDEYVHCSCDRISPEAPVPVLKHEITRHYAGGAGNVACNAAALGAKVSLIGIQGTANLMDGPLVDHVLRSIDYPFLVRDEARPMTRKTRFVVGGQQLLRVDAEEAHDAPEWIEGELVEKLRDHMVVADAVIISDYAKGTLTAGVMDIIRRMVEAERSRRHKAPLIFVGPKRDLAFYGPVDWIVPNERELQLYGSSEATPASLLVTRGARGMELFDDGKVTKIETAAREVFDVVGAGDTVLAVFACAVAKGWSPIDAARLANVAAGIAVSKHGTYAVTVDDLRRVMP